MKKLTPETIAADMGVTVEQLEQLPGTVYEKAVKAYEDRETLRRALSILLKACNVERESMGQFSNT